MLPDDNIAMITTLVLAVAVSATVITCVLALVYLCHFRLERPAVGTFNGRDITMLFVFIVGLPMLYLVLPLELLLVALGITFVSALAIGLRPVLRPTLIWLTIGVLVGTNIWLARTALGTVLGWQVFWVENSVIIILAAVTVANLYVQGGMRLKHVAWFAVILAVYDVLFAYVWPLTTALAQRFLGWPLDPAAGFRWGVNNASIGLGDLLVYATFVIAVYKAYGPASARIAMLITVLLGAVTPALAPLLFNLVADARTDLFIPAQVAFGPAAFLYYRWLRRTRGPERTMAEFLATLHPPATDARVAVDEPIAPVSVRAVDEPIAPVPVRDDAGQNRPGALLVPRI